MNVEGSLVSPVHFDLVAPRGLTLGHVSLAISCGLIKNDRFGDIGGGLDEGLLIAVLDRNLIEVFDVLDGEPIRTNQELSVRAGEAYRAEDRAGMGHIKAAWDTPRRELPAGYRVRVTVRDPLQSLGFFRMFVGIDRG